MRHSHISLLSQLGVSLKAIMERVGHTDHKTTLEIYSHVTEQMDKDMMNKLEKLEINLICPFSALFNLKIIKQPLKPMPKRFLHFMLLFPLYSAWWLRSDVIDYAVNVIYFIYDTV